MQSHTYCIVSHSSRSHTQQGLKLATCFKITAVSYSSQSHFTYSTWELDRLLNTSRALEIGQDSSSKNPRARTAHHLVSTSCSPFKRSSVQKWNYYTPNWYSELGLMTWCLPRQHGTRNMEHWNTGTLEQWNIGTLEHWNIGTLEHWNMEHGTWNMEHGKWNVEHGTWNIEYGTWNVENAF